MYSNDIPDTTSQRLVALMQLVWVKKNKNKNKKKIKKKPPAVGRHYEAAWSQIGAAATLPLPKSSWLNVDAREQHFKS
jgi:hypothetical protein